jgi:hypothetical protein
MLSVITLDMENKDEKKLYVWVTLKMPDGTKFEIPLPPKTFSSGREGFYAQIPSFVYNDAIYGGQIQVWKKTK